MTPKPLSNHFSFLNRFIIKKGDISTRLFLLVILSIHILFFGLGPLCSDLSQSSSPQSAVNEPLLSSAFGSDLRDAEASMPPLTCPGTVKNVVLPFSGFIQNLGQVSDNMIEYYYSSNGLSVGFGASRITFVSEAVEDQDQIYFSLTFPGSDTISPVGRTKNSHYTNYFYGELQLTNVPSWQELWYYNLYPGIDLRYYMSSQGLKYDFVVQPGADPSQILVQVSETMTLAIKDSVVSFQSRTQPDVCFKDTTLRAWQVDSTVISAKFIQHETHTNAYGFQLGSFDFTQTLIIDPVLLSYSTYLGGNSFDYGEAITVDGDGNSYIVGSTESQSFPIQNAYQSTINTSSDIFVTKLNPTGTELVFSTYLGGSGLDTGYDIAVDADGNSYITGKTYSADFPMTSNAYQRTKKANSDAFVTELNATGNGLVFSTYLGGKDFDYGHGIAVDAAGNSYVTGYTESDDFSVTPNAYQTSHGGRYVFVIKLDPTGTELVFSTYLGGSRPDEVFGIAVDAAGNSYVTGYTVSDDFPIQNAYQSGRNGSADVFVTKLNATGTGLVFSTYLGGGGYDVGEDIAVDMNGNCYITGSTDSSDFPVTPNAYQSTNAGSFSVFVTKLNATGNGLDFSTFLGGTHGDWGYGIAVDAAGNSYITGRTMSRNFPTEDAYQSNKGGGYDDAFVAKLNAAGRGLVFSTYLGGSNEDRGCEIVVDTNRTIHVTGATKSDNFPLENAYQSTHGGVGNWDCFVAKLSYFGFLYPTGGDILTGTVTVEWIAVQETSGILYSLFYSPDAGTTWYALATDLSATTYTWDTTSVPDGTGYLLKMMIFNATDLITEYISDNPFSIQNSPIIESGTSVTASPGWTMGIFLPLILTVVAYRKHKKRGRREHKLFDREG